MTRPSPPRTRGSAAAPCLVIKGAREHNLKNIDVTLPRDRLVVVTGLSGSGKSSLAFDTIYAEGERRYVESLSAYARQFLGQMNKPDVDYIEGLSPAVSIDQKSTSHNPRSTVGTVTEIYDYLRLLFARIGVPHCPQCGKVIQKQSVEKIVDQVMSMPEDTRLHLLAPLIRGRKGEYKQIFDDVRKKGFVRVRVNGEVRDVNDEIKLDRYKQHTIDVVVDRLVVRPDLAGRVADSVQTALQMGGGICIVERITQEAGGRTQEADGRSQSSILNPQSSMTFSEHFACAECGINLEELAPRSFSFNSPYGACKTCDGLGMREVFDPKLLIPDASLSLEAGGIAPWHSRTSDYKKQALRAIAEKMGFATSTPLKKLNRAQLDAVMHGTGEEPLAITYSDFHGRPRTVRVPFEGVVGSLQREYNEYGEEWREHLRKYMGQAPCPACHGSRLRPEILAVTIADHHIARVSAMTVGAAHEFFGELQLNERELLIARQVLKEIRERLRFLTDVGLDYLTLDRRAGTLAGGELQRIRLATQIGSGLVGVLYILDEPSIGLHQRDNARLLQTLLHLRDLGNTVIVVEHDEETIRAADHIVDIGPGAGEHGGQVVVSGTVNDLLKCKASLTGQYLSRARTIPLPKQRRAGNGQRLVVRGARAHNLQDLTVAIPLGTFVCVTGVSGSGKSTLVENIIYARLARQLMGAVTNYGDHDGIDGLQHLDKVINIDQSPIGRTPRSNPATYTGTFGPIRDLFTATREARARGYKPGRFSFNVKGGRCEQCSGDGILKIEMHFLPDVYVPCETCKGARYNRETLEVKYKGKSIANVLDMTVTEALAFFEAIPPIRRKLQTIFDVGLGYIKLGQPATTLSGGEAQRVKLATELSKRGTGHTLYVLDEPTTGLHFDDVRKLLDVLHRLVDQGNTVLVIEHNLEVIKTADHLLDLGPEGGHRGGRLVAQGTPEQVARVKESYTGQYLANMLAADDRRAAKRTRGKK